MRNLTKTFTALMLAAVSSANASAQYAFTAGNITAPQGSVIDLPVSLYNGDNEIISCQGDIYLPEGITVDADPTLTSRAKDHILPCEFQTDGAYRFLSYSPTNLPFNGSDGVLFNLPIKIEAAPGKYVITIKNASMTLIDSYEEIFCENTAAVVTVTAPEAPVVIEDFQFYSKPITLSEGETSATLDIWFKNSEAVKAFSFDIKLPAGVNPIYDEEIEEYKTEEGDRIPSRFEIYTDWADGVLAIDGETTRKTSVAAGNDILLSIPLEIAADPGVYQIEIGNQSATLNSSETEVNTSDFIVKFVIGGEPTEYTLLHGVDYTRAEDVEDVTVNYVRTFVVDYWQGLYLPFDVKYDEWNEFGSVAVLDAVSGTAEEPVLEWKVLSDGDKLEANTPCIFQPAKVGEMVLTAENVILHAAPAVETSVSRMGMGSTFTVTGIYKKKTDMATSHSYGLINGVFRPTDDNSHTLNPYLIFLSIESASTPVRIKNYIHNTDGSTTMIEDVDIIPATDGVYYDIMGRKAVDPAKGIYIVNGKKVLINK